MQGRVHLYEGYSPEQVALPVRVMRALGAELLIVTNANGGLNPKFATGDVVVMDDHVNLMFQPAGWVKRAEAKKNTDRCKNARPTENSPAPTHQAAAFDRGARCVCEDLTHPTPYDPALIEAALAIARRENFTAHRGVYIAMTGPSYETRAEYRMLRKFGDCVGMSTVPEVLAAADCGMRVLGLSIVTNVARPDAFEKVDAEEVLHDAALAGANVQEIILGVLTGAR